MVHVAMQVWLAATCLKTPIVRLGAVGVDPFEKNEKFSTDQQGHSIGYVAEKASWKYVREVRMTTTR